MAASLQQWALPRLQQLLPLDQDSLRQIIVYTDTLPKQAAADHLRNLLGDGPQALEFIEGFSLRRPRAPADAAPSTPAAAAAAAAQATDHDRQPSLNPSPADSASEVPRSRPRQQQKRKKANIHALPARQLEGHGDVAGAYRKQDEQDYYTPKAAAAASSSQARQQKHAEVVADNLALREQRPPDATQMPLITDAAAPTTTTSKPKPPPGASGPLMEDLLAPSGGKGKGKGKGSTPTSRQASPNPARSATTTKVSIAGGTAMHGQSTALSDLDSAIRDLELLTNPTLSSSADDTEQKKQQQRQCNCMATRHPLLDIAPNCLSCGKVVCVKQGLGPCTFCAAPLLSGSEIASIVRVLKDERGEERMKANNASHKKADVAAGGKARAFTGREFLAQASARSSPFSSAPATPADSEDEDQAKSQAQAHRDKLLNFQANNAKRTQIHDEAADFDVPAAGTSMWASPRERAAQLKRQQRALREMEWQARPEHEKRRVVASIDLKGGKVVRRMQAVERPDFGGADEDNVEEEEEGDFVPPRPAGGGDERGKGGAFARNPLLGGLIRPRAREERAKGKEKEGEGAEARASGKRDMWRRVQMDEDDNEAWILDGGAYAGRVEGRTLGDEEHAQG